MHLSEDRPGPAGSGDSMGDPEEPVFPAWADSDELTAPEIPLLSAWEPEPPPDFQAISVLMFRVQPRRRKARWHCTRASLSQTTFPPIRLSKIH